MSHESKRLTLLLIVWTDCWFAHIYSFYPVYFLTGKVGATIPCCSSIITVRIHYYVKIIWQIRYTWYHLNNYKGTNWIQNFSSLYLDELGRGKGRVFLLSVMIVVSAWHVYNGSVQFSSGAQSCPALIMVITINFGKHNFLNSSIISIDSFELLFLIPHSGSSPFVLKCQLTQSFLLFHVSDHRAQLIFIKTCICCDYIIYVQNIFYNIPSVL